MNELVCSFDDIEWNITRPGIREKKIVIGSKTLRLLEITDKLDHPDWCEKGHVGYVVEGSLILNIDGSEKPLYRSDVFVVESDELTHRHIPVVKPGGGVTLLLVEENE